MIQVALILIGLFLIFKKDVKISDTRHLRQPHTSILGGFFILAAVMMPFLPADNVLYDAILFGGLVIISIIFMAKADRIETAEARAKASGTKRNVIILLIAIPIALLLVGFLTNSTI